MATLEFFFPEKFERHDLEKLYIPSFVEWYCFHLLIVSHYWSTYLLCRICEIYCRNRWCVLF